jgi:Domain of unknown function (DUF6456)
MTGAEQRLARCLARLAAPAALLAPDRVGTGYGVYAGGDRRRRPMARLEAEQVKRLAAAGTIARAAKDEFVLSAAGRRQLKRLKAAPSESFAAQHGELVARAFVGADGGLGAARGYELDGAIRRLGALRNAEGAPWLSCAELASAQRLRADWLRGQIGVSRGVDWSAPPIGSAPRGPGSAQEAALAAGCDARRRAADALASLAAPLRRVVERVCLYEIGLEAFERGERWPARSAKAALKQALAQLAARKSG